MLLENEFIIVYNIVVETGLRPVSTSQKQIKLFRKLV
jgi:hypothetical protein